MSEVNNKLNIRTKSVIDSESVNATNILNDDKNYYDNLCIISRTKCLLVSTVWPTLRLQ